ncbi:MAG: Uma2 family endonuclease [Candidatus Eremiobacterota bacterium]
MLWPPEQEIDYPTSDGLPMAETDTHRDQMIDLIHGLRNFFAGRRDVYVSGNLLMYYVKGDKRKHRSPDVLVTLGIPGGSRDCYQVWEEGKAPDLIFEITSRSTESEDRGEKKGVYEFLGVREYVLFDPLGEYLRPNPSLFRLKKGSFVPVVGKPLQLETLGLELVVRDGRLRLRRPDTGVLLPTVEETTRLAEQEKARAERAEAELARLRAELDRRGR